MKFPKTNFVFTLTVFGALLALTGTSRAQTQSFFENFDADASANWKSNSITGATTPDDVDNPANFYFDYSTVGIPAAPHSTNGTTRGLKLQAQLGLNVTAGDIPSGVSVSPTGFGISGNFEMRFDWWINWNFGNGSTQIGGAGFGTAGTSPQVGGSSTVNGATGDSIFFMITGDGGTTDDCRVYSPAFLAGAGLPPDVFAAGDRNVTGVAYYTTNFPGQSPPAAQTALYPLQTGTSQDGSMAFKWRDVSLKKIANILTYTIDGVLIATLDVTTNGTLGGTNILFTHCDINSSVSTDPNRFDMAFSLFDNIRVTNFPTAVLVSSSVTNASEQGPTSGVFTLTRTAVGAPLTVSYSLGGTATSNVDYTISPVSTVTFAATDLTTNITITPVDDAIPEATETVVMTVNDGVDYIGSGSATVTIADNESPQLTITNVSAQMYERTNDYAAFKISRLGSTNTAFSVNVSLSGSAAANVDYYADAPAFGLGDESVTFKLHPIEDASVETNETITCTLAAGGGYTISSPSSATVTLVDSTLPPEIVLFSDNFNTDTSSSWTLRFGSTNGFDDYTVEFNYDYSADSIPPAPHSAGDTHGLKMRVNKIEASPFGAAGVNLYPNGQNFSGDFALRFDMYLIDAGGSSATEGGLFGINHAGNKTNWFRLSGGGVPTGWNFDGLFFYVQADNQNSTTDYALWSAPTTTNNNPTKLTFANTTGLTGIFKSPPWAVAGLPANPIPSTNSIWADVEASQVNNVLTLKINNTQILSYTNTGGTTTGNIMMGYVDPFDSVGLSSSAVIYDNVRVIRAFQYRVTSVVKSGGSILIDFTHPATAEPTSAFKLQSSATVDGPYADISATITQPSIGAYHVVASAPDDFRYYRIRHL